MRAGALSLLLVLAIPMSGGLGRCEAPQRPRVAIDSGILIGAHFGSLPGEIAFPGVLFAAAFHAEEMMLISKSYWKSWQPDSNDEKLSDLMHDSWTQFAKTGNPNRAGLPDWPAYDSGTEQCLEFGPKIQSQPIPHKNAYALFQRILDARLAEIASAVDVPSTKY